MKWRHPFASRSLHAGKSLPVELFKRNFKEMKPLQINNYHQINYKQGIKQNSYKKNADFNKSIPLPCLNLPWLWVTNSDVCISQKCFSSVWSVLFWSHWEALCYTCDDSSFYYNSASKLKPQWKEFSWWGWYLLLIFASYSADNFCNLVSVSQPVDPMPIRLTLWKIFKS